VKKSSLPMEKISETDSIEEANSKIAQGWEYLDSTRKGVYVLGLRKRKSTIINGGYVG
jgi:hypothetical protein